MAFDPAPSSWFTGWTEDGTDITVPIATFPELTATEADGTTGDIRKVLWAICEKLWTFWNALVTADKPDKMTVRKSASVNSTTGEITVTYQVQFVLVATGLEVTAE